MGDGSSRGVPSAPLSSNAIGTATNDLLEGCSSDDVVPAKPPPPPRDPAFAVAFSGGGFRATLTALGALRFLADAEVLSQLRYVSSVSGGSVANGLVACHYEELEAGNFAPRVVDDLVIRPFIARITEDSLSRGLVLNMWRTLGSASRTDLLAEQFDRWFFGGRRLEDLSPRCRFIFNAANLTTGVRFGFERDVLGDWVLGLAPTRGTGIRVAQAAAASAAVPGAFAPFTVTGVRFPCEQGRQAQLLDGGAYDNSGLEAVDNLPGTLLVAVNAGGLFRTGAWGGVPVIRDLQRANALLYRQSTGLRRRDMVERFEEWEANRDNPPSWGRQGVLFGLATKFEEATEEWASTRSSQEEWRVELATYETSFNKFPPEICERLIYRGWWLTGATLSAYHRSVLPASLPEWREIR
jgi:NTE family protein